MTFLMIINDTILLHSLIKMVYGFAHTNGKPPTWLMLKHAIQRNFDGYTCGENEDDPLSIFARELQKELPERTVIEEVVST